jgi:hypothetical protein
VLLRWSWRQELWEISRCCETQMAEGGLQTGVREATIPTTDQQLTQDGIWSFPPPLTRLCLTRFWSVAQKTEFPAVTFGLISAASLGQSGRTNSDALS